MSPLSAFNNLFSLRAGSKLSYLLHITADGLQGADNSMLYGAEAFASLESGRAFDDNNIAPAQLADRTKSNPSTSIFAVPSASTPINPLYTPASRPALHRSSTSSTGTTSSSLGSPSSLFSANDAASSVSSASSIGDDTFLDKYNNECSEALEYARVLIPDANGEVVPFYDSDEEEDDGEYMSQDQMYREHLQELDARRARAQIEEQEKLAATTAARFAVLQDDINLLFETEDFDSDAASVTDGHISSLAMPIHCSVKNQVKNPLLPSVAPARTPVPTPVGRRTVSLANDEVYLFYDSEEEDENFNMDIAYMEHLGELERRRRFGCDQPASGKTTVVSIPTTTPGARVKQTNSFPLDLCSLAPGRSGHLVSDSTLAHLAGIFASIGSLLQH